MNPGVTFGIAPQQLHTTYEELLSVWKAADDLGYDCAWLPDHFMPLAGDRQGLYLEEWTTLSTLAMQTRRIRVGPLVLGNTFRHPAVVANMGAALDTATGGRLEMGLGASWFEPEHTMYGIHFPPLPERIRMLGEALQIIKLLWTEDKVDFQGRYYTLTDAVCRPQPVQKPHPTLWVGGAGEKLTLRVIAQFADGWNCSVTPEGFGHKVQVLERHCEAVGRDVNSIQKSVYFVLGIDADRRRGEEKAEKILTRYGPRGNTAAVAGTPQDCIDQIHKYVGLGMSHLILELHPPYDHDDLALFAESVMPEFRK